MKTISVLMALFAAPALATNWVDLVQQNNYLTSPAASAGVLVYTGVQERVTTASGKELMACVYNGPHGQVVLLERGNCLPSVAL